MTHTKSVLITGAASGIGAATARRIATEGVALLLTTRGNSDGLERTAAEAAEKGARVETMLADLSQPGAAADLVTLARERFGRIDQIVSNAGKAQKSKVADLTRADIDAAISLNTMPLVDLVTAARDDLIASGRGRVVSLSSFAANNFGVNDTLFPATAASKAATEALTRALAYELAGDGVTVNCVAPGYTRKVGGHAAIGPDAWLAAARATPNGRIAEPEDVAATIAFLLSDEARHITGQLIRVDGGLSLL